jgi:histidinol-phosphatase (PHP family)
MFDYHMHSTVSFDAKSTALEMALSARNAGLKEICFTDHIDYEVGVDKQIMVFDTDIYNAAYDHLEVPGLKIRRGMEFGLKPYNADQLAIDAKKRDYDFILGSVHFVNEVDPYEPAYWDAITVQEAEIQYLEETLKCVQHHDGYDVLGHLTYLSKCPGHPTHKQIDLNKYRDIVAEIFRNIIAKGKGIEINTSGMDRCGDYLPGMDYVRLYKELGGQIVTIGSDAHTADRVGQYSHEVAALLKDIMGHVCTFEGRKPIFHKL